MEQLRDELSEFLKKARVSPFATLFTTLDVLESRGETDLLGGVEESMERLNMTGTNRTSTLLNLLIEEEREA